MSADTFPIMRPHGRKEIAEDAAAGVPASVPFGLVLAHDEQCQINHSQSAARLRERGGLDVIELWAVLGDRQYPWMRRATEKPTLAEAVAFITAAVAAFNATQEHAP